MDERSERIQRRFEVPVLVAALLSLPVIILEESTLGQPWDTVTTLLNWAIWTTFAVELVVMLVVVPDRLAWLRQRPISPIVVLLTPPFLPASLQAARVLQLVRLVGLVRIVRRIYTVRGLRYAALIAAVTLFAGGTGFSAVETGTTPWDGIWWAVQTMTTVGYGDIVPTTNAGRIIGITVMLVGIGFATVLIGAAADWFLSREAYEEAQELVDVEEALLREVREVSARVARIEDALERRSAPG